MTKYSYIYKKTTQESNNSKTDDISSFMEEKTK